MRTPLENKILVGVAVALVAIPFVSKMANDAVKPKYQSNIPVEQVAVAAEPIADDQSLKPALKGVPYGQPGYSAAVDMWLSADKEELQISCANGYRTHAHADACTQIGY